MNCPEKFCTKKATVHLYCEGGYRDMDIIVHPEYGFQDSIMRVGGGD